ncbi:MAG TPA: type II toxin-antitoxin system PemK/MazF family toxin [Polyangia bacterium]|jgi:mRNA-degrading endonuclease toxin of MazEF toxin-antitoxin module|nr:type II toxin-antitoxin system PemK/MazF family toxin [Polyangia bacterium]
MRRRGYLYWSNLDKRRPALVISIDARNEHATDVIVIPCSTNLRESPTHVRLGRNEGGVPQPSVLKCEQITTIPRAEVEELAMGSALSNARLREVERAIARSIGLPA